MLHVSGISFSYGSLVALDDVSLTVEAGEGVALLGPNGAGKSTLMQVVMGALTPSAGEMTLDGERLGPANRRTLGYVPQDIALQKDLTSRENLEILGACAGLWGKELATAVEEGLALARMEERAGDRIDKLSGGMKRRINLAAGLVHGPTLLLLDEPTAGVDPVESVHIIAALRGWKADGGSFLISTHRMEEAESLCDRVVFIHNGKVLESGTVAEVLSRCQAQEAIHVVFQGDAPTIPAGWPDSLPLERRADRWVVAATGSAGLARVAELVGAVSGLTGLEPRRPDLGVRFRELAGEGLS